MFLEEGDEGAKEYNFTLSADVGRFKLWFLDQFCLRGGNLIQLQVVSHQNDCPDTPTYTDTIPYKTC
jgi:hypothetical protein